MDGVRLDDVKRALDARDPDLAELVVGLTNSADVVPREDVPEGALTYQDFVYELRTWRFAQKSDEEQRHYRVESFKEMRQNELLPERLWLHEIISGLWEHEGAYERSQLLTIIETCPLKWGPWKAIKTIFKEAESRGDTEVLGAIAARLDSTRSGYGFYSEVSQATLTYMVRRGWRYLRRMGESFPSRYPDAAVDFLRFYPESTNWRNTWIANHIFFHDSNRYGQSNFSYWSEPSDLTSTRAFGESWQRTPRPLFTLLEQARAEKVRAFAIEALKSDFRTVLREVESSWVARLAGVSSASVHDFVVWLLKNVPKFEQSSFREMGLHDALLDMLESPSYDARRYIAEYARAYARDLSLERLLRLANNDEEEVRKLAFDLLRRLDPREEVGLDAWGSLLGTTYGHDVAVEALRKHFGASELTPAWFIERLMSEEHKVQQFARDNLLRVHDPKSLGTDFFIDMFDDERLTSNIASFLLRTIDEYFEVGTFDVDLWRRLLLHPITSNTMYSWIREEKIEAGSLGVSFWKALAYHPSWETDEWIAALKGSGRAWAEGLTFDDARLAEFAREMLWDTRQFSPAQIGLGWLLDLVERLEAAYNTWARNYMLRVLVPADFAPQGSDDDDAVHAGCIWLWETATGPGEVDDPLRQFAMTYLLQHHLDIAQERADQPIDESEHIPHDFFSFERVLPLLTDERRALRRFACRIGEWEMARWAPPMHHLVELCEQPYDDITNFISKCLLAREFRETAPYRLGREALSADGVYRFCDSLDRDTRQIGMALIDRYEDLAKPRELFRLAESPDRQMRAFVIRTIWALYRRRGITEGWEPVDLEVRYPHPKTKKELEGYEAGCGARPRPEEWPAEEDALQRFLRRILFEISPSKLPKDEVAANQAARESEEDAPQGAQQRRMRPVPARVAKRSMIEVMRDLGLEDRAFALRVAPLLSEFMGSRGKSERAACLVALTQLATTHTEADILPEHITLS